MSDTPKPAPLSPEEIALWESFGDVRMDKKKWARFRATLAARDQRIEELEHYHARYEEIVVRCRNTKGRCFCGVHITPVATLAPSEPEPGKQRCQNCSGVDWPGRPAVSSCRACDGTGLVPFPNAEPLACDVNFHDDPLIRPPWKCGAPVTSGTRCAAHPMEPRR